jgi:hypothetical protein
MDEFDELMGPPPAKYATSSAPPPPSAFGGVPMTTAPPAYSAAYSHSIPGRWNEDESDVAARVAFRDTAPPPSSTAMVALAEDPNNPRPYYSNYSDQPRPSDIPQQHYRSQQQQSHEPVPRPAYEFRRTASEGVRAYKWQDDEPPASSQKIRQDAMKVLQKLEEPYSVRRTSSGTIAAGVGVESKRRVPAALAGLQFGGSAARGLQNPGGRLSFHDTKYRDDDVMDDEHEAMIMHDKVDMDGDLRAAGPTKKSTWSSRYSLDSTLMAMQGGLSGREILEDIERENQRQRMSARNMIASSAHTIKAKVAENKGKVFGAGFAFRQSNVFGSMNDDDLHGGTNLITKWQDLDRGEAGSVLPPPPPVHKTWQQALLNKRKRRRIIAAFVIALVALIVVLVTVRGAKKRATNVAVKTAGNGQGVPVTFYVTSDVPFDGDSENKLAKDLDNLTGDAEFVIHLGNIQDSSASFCPTTRYSDVASILAKCPVPLLAIPGEHDWIRCPKPDEALQEWTLQFGSFEENFERNNLDINRQFQRVENFSFLHNGVLFLGLHLVTGPIHDQVAHDALMDDNLKFFYGMLNLNKDLFRSIVVFGNARPGPQQDPFFLGVMDVVENLEVPFAYIHANPGTGAVEEYAPFVQNDLILGIQIEDGGQNPPLRVHVGFGNRPFVIG